MRLSRRHLLRWTGIWALASLNFMPAARGGYDSRPKEDADLIVFAGRNFFQAQRPGASERQPKNTPIELPANKSLLIQIINEDTIVHEIHFGRGLPIWVNEGNKSYQVYKENLFGESGFLGLHLNPGQSGFLHVRFREDQKGEWEIGCLLRGHWEEGMHAPLRII